MRISKIFQQPARTFKVDDNVPIPLSGRTTSNNPVNLLVKDGQSLFIPVADPLDYPQVSSAAAGCVKRRQFKIVCRVVSENGTNGIRIWRTETLTPIHPASPDDNLRNRWIDHDPWEKTA